MQRSRPLRLQTISIRTSLFLSLWGVANMAGRRIAKLTDKCKFVDQHVYNDSTTLAIYTFAGDKSDSKIRTRKDAVERELAIGLALCQDDSYVMRVRLGAPTAVEKREFIGFGSGYLDLSSGTLLLGHLSTGRNPTDERLSDFYSTASPFHFARLFKSTVGVSPHEYLTKQRIQPKQLYHSQSLLVGMKCSHHVLLRVARP